MMLQWLVEEGRSKVIRNPAGDGFAVDVDLATSWGQKWDMGCIAIDSLEVVGG